MSLIVQIFLVIFTLASPVFAQSNDSSHSFTAIIYDGNEGSPFVRSAFRGADWAKDEFNVSYSKHNIKNAKDFHKKIAEIVASGTKHIIGLGFQNVALVGEAAPKYPEVKFTVIDGIVPPIYPNVKSIKFKDNEGAFLAGFIATKYSKHLKIGFIGGMDTPIIRNFARGYSHGAKYVNKDVDITIQMIGETNKAWSNPDKAYLMALEQYRNNVDVIFAAAGGSGLGVIKAAKRENKLAIAVDNNKNPLAPLNILTSIVKRVDLAVYRALQQVHDNTWKSGIEQQGIKESALDYSVDKYNKKLISKELIEAVSIVKEKIVNGIIIVNEYLSK